MESLQIIVRWNIFDGNLDVFKKLAHECLEVSAAKDQNTLQYDWYFGENPMECVLLEKYPDSKALLAHLANIGDLLGKLLALAGFRAEVYGNPSEELLHAIKGLPLEIYSFYQGLESASYQEKA